MSADDATARRLDEQLDELIANGGALGDEMAGDELAQVAHLFLVDAANLEMANERAVRRQLLEQIAIEEHRGAAVAPRFKFRLMWRVRRVAITAMCVLVACTAVAVADTKSPAGRAMRTAARAVNIPVPAEPHRAPPHREHPDKPKTDDQRLDAQDRAELRAKLQAEQAERLARRRALLERRRRLEQQRRQQLEQQRLGDGQFAPDGEIQPDGGTFQPDGQYPPPDGQQQPYPDGDGGTLPPPDGQVKPPPDGTAPKPVQPAPTGTAPMPCCQQPPPQPLPPPQ
jgi:hypothetical protein